jgi:thiamine biosynthesis lipoprotein
MSPGADLQAIVELKDKALATSGNYRKFYVEDGVKYAHTIDPATGYPSKNQLLSATIIAEDCASADGLATACMVMGLDKAKEFILQNPGIDAYFIYSGSDGSFMTWMTDGMKDILSEEKEN